MSTQNSHLELAENVVPSQAPVAYEAPAIESVLTPESLEREVHYAGALPASQIKTGA